MGRYINPGFYGFREIVEDDYIDKTGMIEIINNSIGKKHKLFCISRPRRFGKTYAANMLCAYYDCSVDSHELFDGFEISKTANYEEHINKYNVIYLDMSEFISSIERENRDYTKLTEDISTALLNDLYSVYKDMPIDKSLTEALEIYSEYTKRNYIFIIDEWDSVIRETDTITQQKYLSMLRELFKSSRFTPKYIAAAYMTGILPIKKVKSQSAISDFNEYTAINPGKFARYIGFDENDIKFICEKYRMDFDKMKWWYDGYTFGNVSNIYNPYSVMNAVEYEKFASYWRKSSAVDSLTEYIDMNYDGLQQDIIRLVKDEEISVDTSDYQNDFKNFVTKDDVLTLLIHLGYLTYNSDTGLAHIPNEEIRSEFRSMLRRAKNPKLIALVSDSNKILEDTLAENAVSIGNAIDKLCGTNYAPQYYNNEQALRSIIKLAYLTAVDRYFRVEELPSGKGLADIVYIPQRYSEYPAMVIEMKWNKSAESAIEQIKNNNYPAVLQNYGGDILLVGINYSDKEKKHNCIIERFIMN